MLITKKKRILNNINILLAIFFAVIFFYLIKKNNFEIFDINSRFFFNILITLVLFTFHSISASLSPINVKINLTLSSISSYFTIILIEILVTIYLSYFNNLSDAEAVASSLAEEQNIYFDTRPKRQVYDEKKESNEDIVLSFTPAYFSKTKLKIDEIYPLGGISNSPTLHCNESGYYSTYTSDRFGFNNPDHVWEKKIDFLLIGDSFTHGACVDGGYDIASNLRVFYTGKNFINLGMGSNDSLLMYSTWKEYGEKLKPKNLLWLHFENDIVELNTWGKNNELALKYFYEDLNQNLMSHQNEIDEKIKEIVELEYHKNINENKENFQNIKPTVSISNLKNTIRNILFLRGIRTLVGFNNVNEYDPLFLDILIKTKREVNSQGGRLIFVYLPSWERYKFKLLNKSSLYHKKKILNEVGKINIDIVDLDALYFKNHPDPLSLFPFRTRGHYTVDGYKNISKVISDYIKEID
tara:strand:+ start:243 stop:1646 length:1404 start_codon:yes stop_codon:yes gene_type:complete